MTSPVPSPPSPPSPPSGRVPTPTGPAVGPAPAALDPVAASRSDDAVGRRGIQLGARSLREHAARGVLISGLWMAGLGAIQAGNKLVLPALVSPEQFGLWGTLLVYGSLLAAFRTTGTNEIFVGQDDDDQELAFQRIFAIEVAVNGLLTVATVVTAPLLAVLYGDQRLLWLCAATALAWPAQTLQAPLWLLNRRMAFGRLRLVQAIDPVVGTIVTIGLAILGLGAWAIVIGLLAGAWSTAIVAVALCPFRLRPRFDRTALRRYGRISVPLWLAAVVGSSIAFGLLLLARWELGFAAVGAVTLASSLSFFAQRLDQAVSSVLYPAIAAAQDRPEVLRETFAKANRIGLAWAVPVATGLVIFAPELVPMLYHHAWAGAVPVVQWFAVSIAVAHLGINWWQYELADGRSRPMAVSAFAAFGLFLVVQIPPVLLWGLDGLAISMVAQAVGQLAVRTFYIRRRFGAWSPTLLALRSLLPVVPGTVAALLLLHVGAPVAVAMAVFLLLLVPATVLAERPLAREITGYLRGAVR